MKKILLLLAMLTSFVFSAVNINTASKDELKTLKGIGDTKAEAIIAARPFNAPEDIKNVKGIGDSIYKNIEKDIVVK